MNKDNPTHAAKPTYSISRFSIYAAVMLVAFLIGFIPMWLKAREGASRLAVVERELQTARMQNTLASAVIDARRGDYEQARQTASQFFSALRAESDIGSNGALINIQRDKLDALLAARDDLITLLARGDPASADRLSDLYVVYREMIKG